MSDRLRMHSEIRNWLTELRVSFAAAAVLGPRGPRHAGQAPA